jgi:multidrug efflux pump subunit AcrA (membrane-fusion protein)
LQLAYERCQLESLQAVFDREMDALGVAIDDATAELFRLRIHSADVTLRQAESAHRVTRMQAEIERQESNLADLLVRQHQINSPITGMVVELNRRLGDWVEPGDSIARIIRVDRLRAEGFVPAAMVDAVRLADQPRLEIDCGDGTTAVRHGDKVFVSPEIDPVTNEVRFWVEFDNDGTAIGPGTHATLVLSERTNK